MSDAPSRSSSRLGRSLKLYLADGTPSSDITAEPGVSSVRAAVASRTALPELIRREEAIRTGVYLLVGPEPDLPGRQLVYVGEGDQVKTRLAAHDADEAKDFFTRVVLIVSKDENLTKAHGRYLEGRIIAAIRGAGRAKLVNAKEPPFKSLPEPEIADMERVLDEIKILLPVLGFDVLQPTVGEQMPVAGALSPAPTFIAEIKKAKGRAVERGGELVLAEFTALRCESDAIPQNVRDARKAVIEAGVLVADAENDLYRFHQDASFGSPSGASAALAGRADNGRTTWRADGNEQSYAARRYSLFGDRGAA